MNTATDPTHALSRSTAAPRPGPVEVGRARQVARVVCSEWIKARSLASTWSALGTMLFVIVAIGAVISASVTAEEVTAAGPDGFQPLLQAFAGMAMGQVAVGVLGALLITSEYSSRSIVPSLAAIPQRGALLTGKGVLLTVLTAPFAVLASTGAALAGLPLLRDRGVDLATTDAAVVRAVLGTALVLTLTALLGLAVGALLRSTAAAVIVLTVALFLVPVLLDLLPEGVRTGVGAWTPSRAGAAVLALGQPEGHLPPAAGLLITAAWTAAALAVAAVVLRRRDA